MTDITIQALILFLLGLTYLGIATNAKGLAIIAIVPSLVLAFHFADWSSVAFVALAVFNGWNGVSGGLVS